MSHNSAQPHHSERSTRRTELVERRFNAWLTSVMCEMSQMCQHVDRPNILFSAQPPDSIQHHPLHPHFRLLATRFQAAKDLFKQWGSHLGLAAETLSKAAVDDRLDPKTAADVKAVLDIVRSICDDDHSYRPIYSTFDTVLRGATGKWAPKNERKRNLKWMFQDKENQSDHVELFEMIVQRLYELVPAETSTTRTRNKGPAHTVVEMERIMARIESKPQGFNEVAKRLLRDRNLYIDEDDKRDLEEDPAAALQAERHDLLKMLIDGGVDTRSSDNNDWTMLHHAVWFESIESIELLIERGADMKAKTRMGNSVLHLAWSGHAVMTLVELGADLDALNYKDETPLISACLNDYDDAVDRLLYEGATLTPQDSHQRTALHSACLEGHCGIVHSYLENEAEVEVYDEDGETPMHLACFSGHADIVKFLLKAAADTEVKDSYGRAPLNRACYDGFEDVAMVLLESDCDVDTTGPGHRTALNVADRKGHLGIVKLLVERGANLDAPGDQGLTPLHAAAGCGYVKIAKVLLDAGAEVNIIAQDWSTPLHHSLEADGPEPWQLLVDHGADILRTDRDGYTPPHWASRNGNAKAVSFLLEKGADALAITSSHESTLHCAARGGPIHVVKLLLAKGVKLDQGDKYRQMPLEEAAAVGTADFVKFLLQQSPEGSINAAHFQTGFTLLHEASVAGNVDVVRLLLKNPDVRLDRVDTLGRTSLLLASVQGNEEIVRILLADGRTRPDVQDWCGSTALFAAVRNAHTEVAQILLESKGVKANGADGFGIGLLWWERRTGDAKILELLTQHSGKRVGSGATYKPTGRSPLTQVHVEIPYCDACLVCAPELEECLSCDNPSFMLCQDLLARLMRDCLEICIQGQKPGFKIQ